MDVGDADSTIVISPKLKRAPRRREYSTQEGYDVALYKSIPGTAPPPIFKSYESHGDAKRQAVLWSRQNNDAEITERGRDGQVFNQYRASELPQ